MLRLWAFEHQSFNVLALWIFILEARLFAVHLANGIMPDQIYDTRSLRPHPESAMLGQNR